jgi:NADPH2:quinone reductase
MFAPVAPATLPWVRQEADCTAGHGRGRPTGVLLNGSTQTSTREAEMRAIQIAELEGPQAAKLVDIEEPAGGEDLVLVDVHAAGVAFPDALQSRGLYQHKPPLPYTPGAEIAGVVRSAPEGSHLQPGDRVAGLTMLFGAMAEVVALQPDRVFKLPDSVSFEAGAGLLFNDLTVHFALRGRGRLTEGETVLVHGAAGGIGTSTLRLAPAFGAGRTIAVVSSEEKADVARAAGAADVVLADGFKDAVKELTEGRGVDIVVDPVGGDRFTDSLRSLAPGGRLLVVGFTGGDIPTVKVNRLLLNNIDTVGVGWGAWTLTHPGYLQEQWAELEPLLASGAVPAPQPIVYPLERAGEAIGSLEDRSARGKVVIRVR